MAKQFKIFFTSGEKTAVVTAHHFEVDVTGTEMAFFKDEKEKDAEIYVQLSSVAAIVPAPETTLAPDAFSSQSFRR